MRNAWKFRVDPKRWFPIPAMDAWSSEGRTKWIEQATLIGGVAVIAQDVPVSEIRARVTEIADTPRGPESAVFFPVAEPMPVLMHMVTDTAEAMGVAREQWHVRAKGTRAVETTALEGARMSDAVRIARVDADANGDIVYSVAFVGTSGDVGTVWHGATKHPLVAGQFMSMGAEVFATVERKP